MKLYGIKNCDTVKKAQKWLDDQHIDYTFIDLKQYTLTEKNIQNWLTNGQGSALINTRGTTFRQLEIQQKKLLKKENLNNDTQVIKLLINKPTLIKRPILEKADHIEIGFTIERYQLLFS